MSGNSKKASNLVALGSAAVVAVYGAGFMRTAAAAERFAEQSDERVLSPDDAAALKSEAVAPPSAVIAKDSSSGAPSTQKDVATATSGAGAVATSSVNKADATTAKADSKNALAASPSPKRDVTVPVPPQVTSPESTTTSASPVSPTATTTAATVTQAASATSTVATAPVAAAPVVAAPPSAPVTAPVTAPAPTPATTAATTEAGVPKLKDGEYTGYGTSRHGDVEVYLETTDGKITYVKISQCLTQYSCSWISDLPRQVLARQSARVDGVSGATQSANAFYYAVVQALAKAK